MTAERLLQDMKNYIRRTGRFDKRKMYQCSRCVPWNRIKNFLKNADLFA